MHGIDQINVAYHRRDMHIDQYAVVVGQVCLQEQFPNMGDWYCQMLSILVLS
jgi:hypothetical protein